MTLLQLQQLCLSQLGEDEEDLPEFEKALTTYINEAYTALCHSAYHPHHRQYITLINNQFDINQLTYDVVRIAGIHAPAPLGFVKYGNTVQVDDGGQKLTQVQVLYEYTPPLLEQSDQQPVLPQGFHTALADWATARMLGTGTRTRQARAEFFLLRFYEAKSRINAQNTGEKLINQFR